MEGRHVRDDRCVPPSGAQGIRDGPHCTSYGRARVLGRIQWHRSGVLPAKRPGRPNSVWTVMGLVPVVGIESCLSQVKYDSGEPSQPADVWLRLRSDEDAAAINGRVCAKLIREYALWVGTDFDGQRLLWV